MEWLYRFNIIVSAEDKDIANQIAVTIGPSREFERSTFSLGLSSDGALPATHYGCSTMATEEIRAGLESALSSGMVPSVKFTRSNINNILETTNIPEAISNVGNFYDWNSMINDLSLRVNNE